MSAHVDPSQHGMPLTPQVVQAPALQPHVGAVTHVPVWSVGLLGRQQPPSVQPVELQQGSPAWPQWAVHSVA